jgi:hypothetical protein
MTAAGLRRERDRGRLTVEKTAGKEYTTLAAITHMRELCRIAPTPKKALQPTDSTTPVDTERALAAARQVLNDRLRQLAAKGDKPIKGRRAMARS